MEKTNNNCIKWQIILLILIISFGASTSACIFFYKKYVSYLDQNYYLNSESEQKSDYILSILENQALTFNNSNLRLNQLTNIYSSEEDSISFEELVKTHKNLLIFRYSELNCMTCVDQEIIHLKNLVKNSSIKILILTTYEDIKDLYLFIRTNNIEDIPIYNLKSPIENLPLESANIPYYFVLNNSFNTTELFIPSKFFEDQSLKYLNSILSKYN